MQRVALDVQPDGPVGCCVEDPPALGFAGPDARYGPQLAIEGEEHLGGDGGEGGERVVVAGGEHEGGGVLAVAVEAQAVDDDGPLPHVGDLGNLVDVALDDEGPGQP